MHGHLSLNEKIILKSVLNLCKQKSMQDTLPMFPRHLQYPVDKMDQDTQHDNSHDICHTSASFLWIRTQCIACIGHNSISCYPQARHPNSTGGRLHNKIGKLSSMKKAIAKNFHQTFNITFIRVYKGKSNPHFMHN